MHISLRLASPADDAICRALIVELRDAERGIDSRLPVGEAIADEYLRQMHERCAEYGGAIVLAERETEVLGLAMVLFRVPYTLLDEPRGHYAIVAELIVRRAFRRQGIAAALLRDAQARAERAGASELRIGVLSGNTAAKTLYLRAGFAPQIETLSMMLRPTK